MVTGRSTLRRVALVALATLAVLWLLPPEHIHPAFSGQSVVIHRHAIATPTQLTASSVYHDEHGEHHEHGHPDDPDEHGDHSDAQILKTVFASAPKFVPDAPAVLHSTVVIAPSWRVIRSVVLLDDWTCHDPPQRPPSLRAPPA